MCKIFFLILQPPIPIPIFEIMDPLEGGLVLCTNVNDMAIDAILMQEDKVTAYHPKMHN